MRVSGAVVLHYSAMLVASDGPKEAFRTHSNYLRAFQFIITTHYHPTRRLWMPRVTPAVLDAVADSLRNSSHFSRIRPRPAPQDLSSLRSILRNAWGTELLLLTTPQVADDELLGVANNWAVVQAYYACYHAAQALIVARGQPRPEDHTSTLHQSAEFWSKQSLPPWSLACRANTYLNFPRSVNQSVHNWAGCDSTTCWDLSAMALRTTRADPLQRRRREERRRQRTERRRRWEVESQARLATGKPRKNPPPDPKLSDAHRTRIDASLSPTTLLDYLCRLRLRSNYKDPTMFTDGPDDPRESREVHRCLCGITTGTLLVHELHVAQLITPAALQSIADEWLKTPAAKSTNTGLSTRYSTLFP